MKHSYKQSLNMLLYGVLGSILLTIVWQLTGMVVFSGSQNHQFQNFLPLPAFKALLHLFHNHVFWISVLASLRRVAVGLAFAFVFGFTWGVILAISQRFRDLTTLPMQFVRMISPLSWMPIAILVLPSFEYAIYFLILMAAIWPIMHNTTQGLLDVPPSWINMARLQGATKIQVLFRVLLPSALPYVLNGIRLALGIAWIILVPAEYLGINKGLGYLINDARDTMEYDRLMDLVIAIGLLGFILDSIFRLLSKHFDWRHR